MSAQDSVQVMGVTRISVGLSALVKVSPIGFQNTITWKIGSGGGTLEIVPIPVALSGSSAAGWGTGYLVGASEIFNIGGPCFYYLAATGATMVVHAAISLSEGASFL